MAGFSIQATIELIDRFRGPMNSINNSLNGLSRTIENVNRRLNALRDSRAMQNISGGASMAAANLTKVALAATAASAAIGYLVGSQVNKVIQVSAEFEKLGATLEAVEGSAEKAKAGLAWVQKFAIDTPYELNEVSEAYVRMRAYGIDPMAGSLKAAGDAASALDKPIMASVEALSDAMMGENERLKEFGITASKAGGQITYSWQQNNKTMTTSVAANNKALILSTIEGIWNEKYKDAMKKQSTTFSGMLSSMKDQLTGFYKAVGEGGFFEKIKSKMANVLALIADPWLQYNLPRLSAAISSKLSEAVDAIVDAFSGGAFSTLDWSGKVDFLINKMDGLIAKINAFDVKGFVNGIKDAVKSVTDFVDKIGAGNLGLIAMGLLFAPTIVGVGKIAVGFGQAGMAVAKFVTSGAALTAIQTALTAIQGFSLSATFSSMGAAISAAFAPVLALGAPVLLGIAAIAAAGLLVYKNWDLVAEFIAGTFESFMQGIEPILQQLAPLKPAFDAIYSAVEALADIFSNLFEQTEHTSAALKEARNAGAIFGSVLSSVMMIVLAPIRAVVYAATGIGEAVGWVVTTFISLKDGAIATLNNLSDGAGKVSAAIKGAFGEAVNYVSGIFDNLGKSITATFDNIMNKIGKVISFAKTGLQDLGVIDAPANKPAAALPKAGAIKQAPPNIVVNVSGTAKVDSVTTNGTAAKFPIKQNAGQR